MLFSSSGRRIPSYVEERETIAVSEPHRVRVSVAYLYTRELQPNKTYYRVVFRTDIVRTWVATCFALTNICL